MATVEIELRNYRKRKTKVVDGKKVVTEVAGGLQPLVLRVTSGKQVTRKNTGLYIKAAEWDPFKRRVNRKHSEWARLNDALDVLVREAEGAKADLIKSRQHVSGKAVMAKVFAVTDFYDAVTAHLRTLNKDQTTTADNFRAMSDRLKAYRPALSVEEVTPALIEGFKAHLLTRGNLDAEGKPCGYAHNTVVHTLSLMRKILNTVDLKNGNPFDKVVVGTFTPAKVKELDKADIEKLRAYSPRTHGERVALDTFLFSFYAAGMRSSDVLKLKWASIAGDRIIYEQGKKLHQGAAALSIPLNDVTREILSRYDRSTESVFNLLHHLEGGSPKAVRERKSAQRWIAINLISAAKAAGVDKSISFKLARTSFARIANETSGRNIYGIQQTMGHSNVRTTEIYLGTDTRAVDELLGVVYG